MTAAAPPPPSSSLYPLHSPQTHRHLKRLTPHPSTTQPFSTLDDLAVVLSSLTVVGAVAWVPLAFTIAYRNYRAVPTESTDPKSVRKRRIYRILLTTVLAVAIAGPHRSESVGRWLGVKRWRLWKAWMRFVAFEVVSDVPPSVGGERGVGFDRRRDPAIYAIVPHGVFPFALGFSFLPQAAVDVFGSFRPVVATATRFLPFVNTIIRWTGGV